MTPPPPNLTFDGQNEHLQYTASLNICFPLSPDKHINGLYISIIVSFSFSVVVQSPKALFQNGTFKFIPL